LRDWVDDQVDDWGIGKETETETEREKKIQSQRHKSKFNQGDPKYGGNWVRNED